MHDWLVWQLVARLAIPFHALGSRDHQRLHGFCNQSSSVAGPELREIGRSWRVGVQLFHALVALLLLLNLSPQNSCLLLLGQRLGKGSLHATAKWSTQCLAWQVRAEA